MPSKRASKAHEVPVSLVIFAANLRRYRLQRGLTQTAVAAASGLEYKHYQKIEGAAWPGVRLATIERLALALNVSIAELVAEDGMVIRRKDLA